MPKNKRPIHCSYCNDEGHTINKCNDPTIHLLHEEIEEVAAVDWKSQMNNTYLKTRLLSCSVEELKVLGYKINIQPYTPIVYYR